ncbi:histidine phosphatase family protein [Ktedonobacter racemifer]|uniref:Phosphoglycerate mutase n=1 Tax=Ktedonobacter racemifer DSM 44963 TaxID=485913 RepID=D6TV57_KTERA|nr:histidine phosphatase family protein [Ktedonobacter racemifer]EFH84157.1 Phosphoglycerate mutase [Ktedonobacter racemifer DSM 44963]
MTHLYLIRHGDYIEDLEDGKYQDLGLSPEGVRQVEALRERLARTGEIKADVLLSSPMRRAREAAAILASVWEQSVIFDKDFEEWVCDDGTLTPEEFSRRWQQVSEAQKPFYRFMPGYETALEFSGRVQAAFNRILLEHQGKTLVLVTHGGVIGTAFSYFFGLSAALPSRVGLGPKNASITHWYQPASAPKWVLERYNDYHHL